MAWYLGEDKIVELTVRDSAGVVVNITNWSISFMVKRRLSQDDDDAVLTKTTDDDIVITDPTNGVCEATISKVDLDDSDVKAGTYYREFKRTDDGLNAVLAQESFEFTRAVHKGSDT